MNLELDVCTRGQNRMPPRVQLSDEGGAACHVLSEQTASAIRRRVDAAADVVQVCEQCRGEVLHGRGMALDQIGQILARVKVLA